MLIVYHAVQAWRAAADLEGFAHSAAARPKSSDQVPAIAIIFLKENRQSWESSFVFYKESAGPARGAGTSAVQAIVFMFLGGKHRS